MKASYDRVYHGTFGRVVLLDMTRPLIVHVHPQHHVLCKISGVDGAMNVSGELLPLDADSVVLINAWEPHSYVTAGDRSSLLMAFYLEPTWLGSLRSYGISPCQILRFERRLIDRSLELRRLIGRFASYMLYDDFLEAGTLEEIAGRIVVETSTLSGRIGSARQNDFRIRRAIRYIRSSPADDINTTSLAKISGLSIPHFFELFKRCTGVTPRAYINATRMERAFTVLSTDKVQMCQVSDRLGFQAQSNFTRFFRDHVGITPSSYQRIMQQLD